MAHYTEAEGARSAVEEGVGWVGRGGATKRPAVEGERTITRAASRYTTYSVLHLHHAVNPPPETEEGGGAKRAAEKGATGGVEFKKRGRCAAQ
jgi:hypothetical protein